MQPSCILLYVGIRNKTHTSKRTLILQIEMSEEDHVLYQSTFFLLIFYINVWREHWMCQTTECLSYLENMNLEHSVCCQYPWTANCCCWRWLICSTVGWHLQSTFCTCLAFYTSGHVKKWFPTAETRLIMTSQITSSWAQASRPLPQLAFIPTKTKQQQWPCIFILLPFMFLQVVRVFLRKTSHITKDQINIWCHVIHRIEKKSLNESNSGHSKSLQRQK